MTGVNQNQQKVVNRYLAPGETVKASTVDQDNRLVVVTDRQVLSLAEDTRGRADTREIESTLLTGDHVIGTEVEIRDSPDVDLVELIIAGGMGVIGLVMLIASSGGVEQELQLLVGFCGLVLVGLGAFLGYRAYDTPDGEIEVTIQTLDDEDDRTLGLPKEADDVARAVTTTVGASHP